METFVQFLKVRGVISEQQIKELETETRTTTEKIAKVLIRKNLLPKEKVVQTLQDYAIECSRNCNEA
jgi:hypothetical protein